MALIAISPGQDLMLTALMLIVVELALNEILKNPTSFSRLSAEISDPKKLSTK